MNGYVSFNQRIVFIEGDDSSADRAVYEAFYPPGTYNISFVPAGNSATVRRTAERINELLNTSMPFQGYYSIVDGDIERAEEDPTAGDRLFKLPVYHVENLLLDADVILEVTGDLLAADCPYQNAVQVDGVLKELLLECAHLKPLAAALLDARLAKLANETRAAVFGKGPVPDVEGLRPDFVEMEDEARNILRASSRDGTWREICKGRELLKAYCGRNRSRFSGSS